MSLNGDPSKASVALAIQLGIAKEGEPLTPLMSMLTTLKDYAEHVDIGAYKGTQASWASCIPHAENLLQLEREVLGKLREKIAEWDSKLLSRTGELAELNERLERMTQETARANEELTQATQKQSDANKQLSMTLQVTRTAQENHAKDEQRLKQKEDLLTIRSDDLEKQKALAATKEACLKRRLGEIEVRESKMAATQRLAMDSDTQAKRHLDAIRKAHSTLWMLTDKTGNPTAGLSAEELVVGLQSLTSNIQYQIAYLNDQIVQLNDSRTEAEVGEAKAREISNRELKALRDDVVAKASMIKKAELCAADYKDKHDSLQATSSERIHELELSNQDLLITSNSLQARLSEAQQNHAKMATEYSKYKALERTEKALNKHIQDMEGRLQAVERQRDNANAANRTFEIEIERVQGASNARILELEETVRRQEDVISRITEASDTKILDLEGIVKRQRKQLNDADKLAKEREDKLRKADDLNTSLYHKLKDAASARDSATKCRVEHQDFEELKRRSSELEAQVEDSTRARIDEREISNQTIKALTSQNADSQTQVEVLKRTTLEDKEANSQATEALEDQIARLRNQVKQLESRKARDQEIKGLMTQVTTSQTEVTRLSRIISDYTKTHSETAKALEEQFTQFKTKIMGLESEKAEATERAMTADRTLRTHEDHALQEITSVNAALATALDDARQARHDLESLQRSMTLDNPNRERASNQPRKKRRAEEMLEEDRATVLPGNHEYNLQDIRDPDFTDPNIPAEVLNKLVGQFHRWDQKVGQGWARHTTKNRCVETRLSQVAAQRQHGNGHACEYCCDRGRICVVVRQAGIITLLPVHQDGEAVGPEEEGYWTK